MKKKYTVLVVDDAFFIRNLIKRAVGNKPSADYNYEFELIGEGVNGEEGLLLYKSLKPDVVTADVNMGSLGGVKFIKAVKKINPKAKIIIISSSLDNKLKAEVSEQGCFYIQKPFQEAYLWTKLDKIAEELMKEEQERKTTKLNTTAKKEEVKLVEEKPKVIEEKPKIIKNKENKKKELVQETKENKNSFHKNENLEHKSKKESQSNKNKQHKPKENKEVASKNNHKKTGKQNNLSGFVVEEGVSIKPIKNNDKPKVDKEIKVKQEKKETPKKKEQKTKNSSREVMSKPKSIQTVEVLETVIIPPKKTIKDVKVNVTSVKRVGHELNDLGLYEMNEVEPLDMQPRKKASVNTKVKVDSPIKSDVLTKKDEEVIEVVENETVKVTPAETEEKVVIVEEPALEFVKSIIEDKQVEDNESSSLIIEEDLTPNQEKAETVFEDEFVIEDDLTSIKDGDVIITDDEIIIEDIQEVEDKETLISNEEEEFIILDSEDELLISDESELTEDDDEIIIDEVLEIEDEFIFEEEESISITDDEELIILEAEDEEDLVIIEDEDELTIEDDEDLLILEEDEDIEEDSISLEGEFIIDESETELVGEEDTAELLLDDEILLEDEPSMEVQVENSIENELLSSLSYDLDVELTQVKPKEHYNLGNTFEFSIEQELQIHKPYIEEKENIEDEDEFSVGDFEETNDSYSFSNDVDDDDDDWDLFDGEMDLEFDVSNEINFENDEKVYDNANHTQNEELNSNLFNYNKAYQNNSIDGPIRISPPKDNKMKEIYHKKMEEEYSIGFEREESAMTKPSEEKEKKKSGLFLKIFNKRKRT